jgi:hypothetical protein
MPGRKRNPFRQTMTTFRLSDGARKLITAIAMYRHIPKVSVIESLLAEEAKRVGSKLNPILLELDRQQEAREAEEAASKR